MDQARKRDGGGGQDGRQAKPFASSARLLTTPAVALDLPPVRESMLVGGALGKFDWGQIHRLEVSEGNRSKLGQSRPHKARTSTIRGGTVTICRLGTS